MIFGKKNQRETMPEGPTSSRGAPPWQACGAPVRRLGPFFCRKKDNIWKKSPQNFSQIGPLVPEISVVTDGQTDRHTASFQKPIFSESWNKVMSEKNSFGKSTFFAITILYLANYVGREKVKTIFGDLNNINKLQCEHHKIFSHVK